MIEIHVKSKLYLKFVPNQYQKLVIPPFRACFLHYDNDPKLFDLKYQYLLGEDLLVASVIKPNTTKWKVYLPEDERIHICLGKKYRRGMITVEAPLGEPLGFYRENTSFSILFESLKEI